MRPSALRYGVALGLVLCASLLSGGHAEFEGVNTDNADTHHPCTNSVNGNVTSATTDENGDIIIGCGNVIANNSAINDQFHVNLQGDRNVIRNNVEKEGSNAFDIKGSDNKFIGNQAGARARACASGGCEPGVLKLMCFA